MTPWRSTRRRDDTPLP
ncbi:hypothetical protein YPPY93_1198, partial [Yersinia pestis PY-93]